MPQPDTCEDRYYVKEHSGYPINLEANNGIGGGGGKLAESIEIMVLDRAYCHRVAWSSWWAPHGPRGRNSPRALAADRRVAAALCSQWNAEDRADAA